MRISSASRSSSLSPYASMTTVSPTLSSEASTFFLSRETAVCLSSRTTAAVPSRCFTLMTEPWRLLIVPMTLKSSCAESPAVPATSNAATRVMSVRIDEPPPAVLVAISFECLECPQLVRSAFLRRADFEGAVVETGRREADRHRLAAGVLPVPAVNAGERRCQRAVAGLPRRLVVRFEVSLRAVIGLAVELVHHRRARLPREEHLRAHLQVVLVFEVVVRLQRNLPRIELVLRGIVRPGFMSHGRRNQAGIGGDGRSFDDSAGLHHRCEPER